MDFTFTDDERAVTEAAAQVAGAADPWAALADGGWLDILLEDERGLGYLGLVAEALGAGRAWPYRWWERAVVWPTLFGGSAGGRRVAVADPATARATTSARTGSSAECLVVLRDGKAGIHEKFSVEPRSAAWTATAWPGSGWRGRAADRCKDPDLVAEARRRAAAITGRRDGRRHRPDGGDDRRLRDRAPAVRPADLRLPGRGPRRRPARHPGPGGDLVGPAGLHVAGPVDTPAAKGWISRRLGGGRRRWPTSSTARSGSPRSTASSA